MFKHVFDAMHEALDSILYEYPLALGDKKQQLDEQISMLSVMSDSIIEEWLTFEEKLREIPTTSSQTPTPTKEIPLSAFTDKIQHHSKNNLTERAAEAFERGQGYYTLLMYGNSIEHFKEVLTVQPDFLLARMYLGMAYLRMGNEEEALQHFQFVIPLTNDVKMKAIAYHALGSIYVKRNNVEKAMKFFKMALEIDPTSIDPFVFK